MGEYIVILFIMLFGVLHFDILNKKNGRKKFFIFLIIILILLEGLRYRVGGDSLSYEEVYDSMPTFRDIFLYGHYYSPKLIPYQPFWLYLVAFSKWIGKDYVIFQIIHAIIVNTLLSIYIYINSSKPFTVFSFLFVTHFYFYLTIEVEREILAVCVFLLNLKNLQEKKWTKYYFLCFISVMFHISAIFLFFLPIFRNIKISKMVIIIVIIALSPIIFFKETFLQVLKPIMILEVLESKFKSYSKIEFSFAGLMYHYTVRVLCVIPILLYNYKVKNNEDKQWLFNVYVITSILSLALVGFERFLNYLLLPYLIFFTDYMYNMPYKINIIRKSLIICITFLSIVGNIPQRLLTSNKYGTPYASLFYPYVSVFDKKQILDRENYMRENEYD